MVDGDREETRSTVGLRPGLQIDHYRIIERIGSGGMGEVYLAQDTKLDRRVALKFLYRNTRSDDLGRQRFLREARAASAMDHPNICTIHEVGETQDGTLYLAMAWYDGETLKPIISRRSLNVTEAIEICMQAARGLAAVHDKGIIHRDIKPGNIVLTRENQVKILDFGLARADADTQITRVGTTVGTVSYMSPEQIRCEDLDARTDVWGLGVVLFELITGQRPFGGGHDQAIIHNILNAEPPDMRRLGIPPQVVTLLQRALDKDRVGRYPNMHAFLQALEHAHSRQELSLATPRSVNQPAIAVLPFANMSAEPDQDYFCDGMAEEILNALIAIKGLRVAARTSSFQFKEQNLDLRDVGRSLNVDVVMEGSVRKAGKRFRIAANLVNVEDGSYLWSQRYERDLEDVFAIQDEIAKAIAGALKVQLQIPDEEALVARPTERFEVYDLYLKALYSFNKRTDTDNLQAIDGFLRATQRDPTFALAYAGLAYSYIERFFSHEPSPQWESKAFEALERALQLDPNLAEAHAAKGNLMWTRSQGFPHRAAIAEYEEAIRLRPDVAQAYNDLGRVLWHVGAINRARGAFTMSIRIDPSHANARYRLGMMEVHCGRYEHGLKLLTSLSDTISQDWTKAWRIIALLYLDRHQDIRKLVETFSEADHASASTASPLAILHAKEGRRQEALRLIEYALSNGSHFGHFHHISNEAAAVYTLLGDHDKALVHLEDAAREGFPCYPYFEADPFLAKLRGDARFERFLVKLRLEWADLNVS